jgi:hypothetical protein
MPASLVTLVRVDTRRLLLGDWHPIVRDAIDVLRIVLLLSALGALIVGEPGAAALLGALGVLTLVARVVQLPRLWSVRRIPGDNRFEERSA